MSTLRARLRLALLATTSILAACSSSTNDAIAPGASPAPGGSASAGDAGTSHPGVGSDGGGGGDDSTDGGASDNDGGAPIGPLPGTCPPSWTTTPACGGSTSPGAAPDFGPNVLVFDPSMAMSDIQAKLDTVNGQMDGGQFDSGRYAYFFKPGKYALDVRVGFYTHVVGLGRSPDDVTITGAVRAKADWLQGNATCNFWRTAENFAVIPGNGIDNDVNRWAVSQGTALRRAHIMGTIDLDDNGWSSGGFIADSKIDGQINSGSQQQFLTRNVDLHQWNGQNWNMVFVGDNQAPANAWPDPPYTTTDKTPLVREKPFLYVDAAGSYFVMVPALKKNSQGSSWAGGAPPGSPISIDNFYLAKPKDTAATLNAALAQGKHLMFTPGIYHLDATLQITRPGTVVLGLGLATLIADDGVVPIQVADVDAVTLGGLLMEAGPTSSPTLLHVGTPGSTKSHAANPTFLFDMHCRIGGANAGATASCTTIDSNDVVIDNTWLWRADHGAGGSDWNQNKSKNGIIVNGDGVTAYGLFVEHFQEYQTLWNGNGGSVFFYQSEMPYDPPSQNDWKESANVNGYPSYKVADSVTTHQAQGIGVYSVFQNDVAAENAVETPGGNGVSMHHIISVSLASGTINHIINGTGGSVGNGNQTAKTGN